MDLNLSAEFIWALLGIVLILAEYLVPSFVIFFFGAGAIVTSITTFVGLTPNLPSQLIVFIISSLVFLFTLRKYLKGIFKGKVEEDGTIEDFNQEIGKKVKVIETIDPDKGGGKVKHQGTIWEADSEEPIQEGEMAEITGRDNITLKVKKI